MLYVLHVFYICICLSSSKELPSEELGLGIRRATKLASETNAAKEEQRREADTAMGLRRNAPTPRTLSCLI